MKVNIRMNNAKEVNRLRLQSDELLAALKALRADHSIQNPHHEDMCQLCRAADAAIAKAEPR